MESGLGLGCMGLMGGSETLVKDGRDSRKGFLVVTVNMSDEYLLH